MVCHSLLDRNKNKKSNVEALFVFISESLFFHSHNSADHPVAIYLLPLKSDVRKQEKINTNDVVDVLVLI